MDTERIFQHGKRGGPPNFIFPYCSLLISSVLFHRNIAVTDSGIVLSARALAQGPRPPALAGGGGGGGGGLSDEAALGEDLIAPSNSIILYYDIRRFKSLISLFSLK